MSRYTRYRELVRQLGKSKIELTTLLDPNESVKNQTINDMMCNSMLSYDELVILRQYAEAIVNGSTKAAEFVRDTLGEKPATNVDIKDERQTGIKNMSDEELKALIDDLTKNTTVYPTIADAAASAPADTPTPKDNKNTK